MTVDLDRQHLPAGLGARGWRARPGIAAAAAGSILPGLLLAVGLACVATLVQRGTGMAALSPLVVAMVLGMAVGNLRPAGPALKPGIAFAMKRILRFAIVLLGFQLTLGQVASIGWQGIAIVVTCLGATFLFTTWAGRTIGVDHKLTQLIAAGTSVCGASAVIAANTVTRGKDEDVAYAIACVTVFGTLLLLILPLLGAAMSMTPESYGLWAGASIHEVGQVVAAAFQGGEAAGQTGTIAKLSRVLLLAPLIVCLGVAASRRSGRETVGTAPLPFFVAGFLGVVVLNSLFDLDTELRAGIATTTTFLLTVALAAMGLETNFGRLRAKGLRPLALGAAATAFIATLALILVALLA